MDYVRALIAMAAIVLMLGGALAALVGLVLVIGNTTGLYPTGPLAGTATVVAGCVAIWLGFSLVGGGPATEDEPRAAP